MPGGLWCIVETRGDYYQHASIRCFFPSEEAALIRWGTYDDFDRINKEVRFVNYGEAVDF